MVVALQTYERSLAEARTNALALGLTLLRAQSNRRLAATVGRQALAAITSSQAGLDEALRHADATHRAVSIVARHLGIEPSAYGEQKGPGDRAFTSAELGFSETIA